MKNEFNSDNSINNPIFKPRVGQMIFNKRTLELGVIMEEYISTVKIYWFVSRNNTVKVNLIKNDMLEKKVDLIKKTLNGQYISL